MTRAAVVALSLLLAVKLAGASEIPQSLLDADYAQCFSVCSRAQDESQCIKYCSCVTDRERTEFTLDEYMPMAMAMAAGQQADSKSMTKLSDIATACVRDSFQ